MPFDDQTETQPAALSSRVSAHNTAQPTSTAAPARDHAVSDPDRSEPPPAPDCTLSQTAMEADEARSLSLGSVDLGGHTECESPAEADYSKRRSSKHLFAVPGYDLLGKLGAGTYGEVWRARDQVSGVEVAIKFFSHGTSQQWLLLQAEVKQLAMVASDPGIIQLKDVEPDAKPPYYVMAFAEKGCLAKRLHEGPIPAKEALAIFRQVAQTLAYVHAKGIRHCDLKPGNILLDALGRPRVADFGQAHLSDDASPALGTFFYMAPEQADLSGQVPDTRWDVFGLGALFYAMVVGQPPRRAGTIDTDLANTAELSHRLVRYQEYVKTAPRPIKHRSVPGMDRAVADLIDRCLAIDPEKRPRDAAAVVAELDRIERWKSRRGALVVGLTAPVLLLALLGFLGCWQAESTLAKSRQALEVQLGQSDRTSATLAAYKIKDQLAERSRYAEECARDDQLKRVAIKFNAATSTKEDMDQLLSCLKTIHENGANAYGERFIYRSVFFDGQGRLQAVYPPNNQPASKENLGKSFAWREFFNGKADQPDKKDHFVEPVRTTHVCQPFVSSSQPELGVMIGFSTPVFDAVDKNKVVGVLLLTIEFEKLNEWLRDVDIKDGFVVILNSNKNMVYHKQQQKVRPVPKETPKVWDSPLYDKILQGEKNNDPRRYEVYEDPVDDGNKYLAGYAWIGGNVHWGVIVQHDYDKVMAPVDEMTREMVRWGLVMLAAAVGLLIGLGVWLLRLLRREEAAYA